MIQTLQRLCTRRNLAILLTVVFFLSLIPPLMLSFYAYPAVDDFSFGAKTYEAYTMYAQGEAAFMGIIKAAWAEVVETYYTWQGTYASIFLFSLQPGVFGTQYYFMTTWIMLTLLIVSVYRLVSVIVQDCLGKTRSDVWLIVSLLLMLCIQFAPSVKEMLYWYNGAIHYIAFFSVLLCDIAEHLLFFKNGKLRHIPIMAIFGCLLGGGNLVTALLSAELLALLLLYTAWKRRDKLLPLLIPTAALCVGFCINIAAPGNALRQASHGINNKILGSVLQSFSLSVEMIPTYFHKFVFLSLPLIVLILYYLIRDVNFSFPLPGAVCLLSYLILTSTYAPTIYGMGDIGGYRVENIRYLIFLLLLFFCIAYVEGWLMHKLRQEKLAERIDGFIKKLRIRYGMLLTVSVLLCFVCCLALSKGKRDMATTGALRSLLNGEAAAFLEENKEREKLLLSEESIVRLPLIKTQPALLHMPDIAVEGVEEYWINEDMAEYYRKEKILLGE